MAVHFIISCAEHRCHSTPCGLFMWWSSCQVGWQLDLFGACLGERGSTRTGNRHACKILSLVAHIGGLAVHYGGDERKLCPLIFSQAKIHTSRITWSALAQTPKKQSAYTFLPANLLFTLSSLKKRIYISPNVLIGLWLDTFLHYNITC